MIPFLHSNSLSPSTTNLIRSRIPARATGHYQHLLSSVSPAAMANQIQKARLLNATLEFLLNIPYLEIEDLDPDSRDCAICLEPYRKNAWNYGVTINRPVQVKCGHIFGLHCLARMMLSENLNSHCPLCSTPILPPTSPLRLLLGERVSRTASTILEAAVEADARFRNGKLDSKLKNHLFKRVWSVSFEEQAALAKDKSFDRPLLLLEECLEKLSREHQVANHERERAIQREMMVANGQIQQRPAAPMPEPFPPPTPFRAAIAIGLTLAVAFWCPLRDEGSLRGIPLLLDAIAKLSTIIHLLLGSIIVAFDPPRRVPRRLTKLLFLWIIIRLWVCYTDSMFQASLRFGEGILRSRSRQVGGI